MTKARQLADLGNAYDDGALSNRNLIINGSMIIDQRNGGASVTPSNGTLTLDRWKAGLAQTSKFSLDQDSESPAGFTTSMKVTSLTAYTPSSNDHFFIEQEVEGYNAIPLALGSSDAKDISISFWVRSSLTGTFAGSVINSARNRSRVFEYTINTANTWEHKTVSFAGDTTGTWLTTSGKGVSLRFNFGAAGTWLQDAGSWSTGNVTASSGSVNLVATNNATLYITGVQLEVGDTATPFEHRSYGEELAACQRYFELLDYSGSVGNAISNSTQWGGTTDQWGNIMYKYPKRATPSGSVSGSVIIYGKGNISTATTPTLQYISKVGLGIRVQPSSFTSDVGFIGNSSNFKLSVDAEL